MARLLWTFCLGIFVCLPATHAQKLSFPVDASSADQIYKLSIGKYSCFIDSAGSHFFGRVKKDNFREINAKKAKRKARKKYRACRQNPSAFQKGSSSKDPCKRFRKRARNIKKASQECDALDPGTGGDDGDEDPLPPPPGDDDDDDDDNDDDDVGGDGDDDPIDLSIELLDSVPSPVEYDVNIFPEPNGTYTLTLRGSNFFLPSEEPLTSLTVDSTDLGVSNFLVPIEVMDSETLTLQLPLLPTSTIFFTAHNFLNGELESSIPLQVDLINNIASGDDDDDGPPVLELSLDSANPNPLEYNVNSFPNGDGLYLLTITGSNFFFPSLNPEDPVTSLTVTSFDLGLNDAPIPVTVFDDQTLHVLLPLTPTATVFFTAHNTTPSDSASSGQLQVSLINPGDVDNFDICTNYFTGMMKSPLTSRHTPRCYKIPLSFAETMTK